MTNYTNDQIMLKNYLVHNNVNSQFKTVTDLTHWAEYGIYNVTDYEKYQLTCVIKEASGECGGKVRVDFNEHTLKELKDMCDYYCAEAHKANIAQEKAKKQNATKLVKRIKKTCKLGANNYKTALRWILDADGYTKETQEWEAGFICYCLGLDYKYEKVIYHVLDLKCDLKWSNGRAYI